MTQRITLAAALAVLALPAFAQMAPPGRFWRDPRLVQELGLKAAQVEELEQLHSRDRERMVDLRAAVEKGHLAVEDAFDRDPFDEAAARAAEGAVEAALAELHKAEASMRIAVRKVLTFEQFRKLGALRPPMPPRPPRPGMGPRPPASGGPGGPPDAPPAPEPPVTR